MKTLVVYTSCNDPKYDLRIKKFIRDAIYKSDEVTFVMVFNGGCEPHIKLLIPDYVKYVERENLGFDFAAWSRVILHKDIIDYENYDAFIFINSSVYGPCLPRYVDKTSWTKFFSNRISDKVKLVGCSVNYEWELHMQSYCWCVDKVFLKILIKEKYFNDTNTHGDKWFYIATYEVRNIRILLSYGYDYYSFEYFRNDPVVLENANMCPNHLFREKFGSDVNPFDVMFVKPEFNSENSNFKYILRIDGNK
jgi:lipopolysaccharide biosynthesis protein